MASDIHNYQRRVELIRKQIEREPRIPPEEKDLFFRFQRDLTAQGLSQGRVARKLFDLKTICTRWLPEGTRLSEATLNDIKELVANIETSNYSESTKRDLKVTIRSLFSWLRNEPLPKEVAWFRTSVKRHKEKLPEEMLTEDEVRKLIGAEPNPRQRAFIAVLYESGCRIGEVLGLKLKHIGFDNYGAQLLVQGKTGSRRVRIVAAVPYLAEWLNVHPVKDNPEAYVWCLSSGARPTYNSMRNLLCKAAERAGVKKRVHPHNFRHSRATALAQHLTEAQMKEYFGWVQASEMAAVYVHLSGRDVDGALLRLYGLNPDAQLHEAQIKPKTCGHCREQNGFANLLCKRCGSPLGRDSEIVVASVERSNADNVLDRMLEDEEFRHFFLKKARHLLAERFFGA